MTKIGLGSDDLIRFILYISLEYQCASRHLYPTVTIDYWKTKFEMSHKSELAQMVKQSDALV